MSEEKKKCFVITPIGEENSSIRRHIDGIINAAIKPALECKYDVSAAHEHTKTGSINNQVITSIYTADLVVANLTTLNPNVMYELAIRHALRKPVIMIMEKGDLRLPFDVINERTIFYVNDSQGVLDLRNEIRRIEEDIDHKLVSNPIYDALNSYISDKEIINNIKKNTNKDDANVLEAIFNKINTLEIALKNNNYNVLEKDKLDNSTYFNMLERIDDEYNKIVDGYYGDSNLEKSNKIKDLSDVAINYYSRNSDIMNMYQKATLKDVIERLENDEIMNDNNGIIASHLFKEYIKTKSIE